MSAIEMDWFWVRSGHANIHDQVVLIDPYDPRCIPLLQQTRGPVAGPMPVIVRRTSRPRFASNVYGVSVGCLLVSRSATWLATERHGCLVAESCGDDDSLACLIPPLIDDLLHPEWSVTSQVGSTEIVHEAVIDRRSLRRLHPNTSMVRSSGELFCSSHLARLIGEDAGSQLELIQVDVE